MSQFDPTVLKIVWLKQDGIEIQGKTVYINLLVAAKIQ